MDELQNMIIIIDENAPSFCYYDAEKKEGKLIPFEVFEKGIVFAQNHVLGITIIHGSTELPEEYRRLLDSIPHSGIFPYNKDKFFEENDIVVMDVSDELCFPNIIINQKITHLILSVPISDVKKLFVFIENNSQLLGRLSVILKGIEVTRETELNEFRLSLNQLQPLLFDLFSKVKFPEIGFASDRMILNQMNNCNAGVSHITLAPDGLFYICPGFYYNNEKQSIGSLDKGVEIPNHRLLKIENAPLCKTCDCYQCKRCVYLNKKLTLEWNTPSHQQCVISHHERNLSGMLLQKLQRNGIMQNFKSIDPLYYLDPLEYYKDIAK